jgi:hypothetical protein
MGRGKEQEIKKISEQDFIELVRKGIKGILDQGKPAKTEIGKCKYLTDTGLKCIVGHMMPDDKTRRSADNTHMTGIGFLYQDKTIPWVKQFDSNQFHVLAGLQNIHDYQPKDTLLPDFEQEANSILDNYINKS